VYFPAGAGRLPAALLSLKSPVWRSERSASGPLWLPVARADWHAGLACVAASYDVLVELVDREASIKRPARSMWGGTGS
jgi:hypothetical protein